jgi:hypothetical protein
MPTAPGPLASVLFSLGLLVPFALALGGVAYLILQIVRLAFVSNPDSHRHTEEHAR